MLVTSDLIKSYKSRRSTNSRPSSAMSQRSLSENKNDIYSRYEITKPYDPLLEYQGRSNGSGTLVSKVSINDEK